MSDVTGCNSVTQNEHSGFANRVVYLLDRLARSLHYLKISGRDGVIAAVGSHAVTMVPTDN